MSARPIVARGNESPADADALMRVAGITHLPVIDGVQLTGMWISREDGPPVLLGRERVHETGPDVDAADAISTLVGDAEAVLVWDSGVPVGLLTRADVMMILRSAIRRGIGRRHPPPLVVRIRGSGGVDVAPLIARTIGALGRLDVGFLPADPAGPPRPPGHWLGDLSDAEIVLAEETEGAGAVTGRHATDAELSVIVVPAGGLAGLAPEQIAAADALVVTWAGEATEAGLHARVDEIRHSRQGRPAFIVGAGPHDEGLAAWTRWIEARALRRRR